MTTWLKTFRKDHELSPRQSPDDLGPVGEQRLFYEPESLLPDGSTRFTERGEPWGRPGFATGDLIAAYWSGTYRVSELWEVIGEPEPSELDGWSWQTLVKLVGELDPGPTLDELAVPPSSLGRRVRLRLDSGQEARLLRAFGR